MNIKYKVKGKEISAEALVELMEIYQFGTEEEILDWDKKNLWDRRI